MFYSPSLDTRTTRNTTSSSLVVQVIPIVFISRYRAQGFQKIQTNLVRYLQNTREYVLQPGILTRINNLTSTIRYLSLSQKLRILQIHLQPLLINSRFIVTTRKATIYSLNRRKRVSELQYPLRYVILSLQVREDVLQLRNQQNYSAVFTSRSPKPYSYIL